MTDRPTPADFALVALPAAEQRAILHAGGTVDAATWRNQPGRTPLRSVRLCETGRGWLVHGPAAPASTGDLTVRRLRCWSPSCARCGPIVGAQDLARLEPAITARRWVYVVCSLGPDEFKSGARAAAKRRAAAFAEWRELVSEQIGPPRSEAFRATLQRLRETPEQFRPWSLFPTAAERDGPRRERLQELTEDRVWFELARQVEPPPAGWTASEHPYHVANWAFGRRLKRTLRTKLGAFDYVATWEAHRSGLPHLNLIIDADAFGAEALGDATRPGTTPEGRPTIEAPALRAWFRRAAMAAGFGRVFWLEVCEPRGPGLALYVSKLSRELMSPTVKGQAPWRRPPRFKRYQASGGLLAARFWPKGRAVDCRFEHCPTEPPPGGWCSRSLPRHLREVHGMTAAAARGELEDILAGSPTGHAAILETDAPDPRELGNLVAGWGRSELEAAAWRPVARALRDGSGAPTVID